MVDTGGFKRRESDSRIAGAVLGCGNKPIRVVVRCRLFVSPLTYELSASQMEETFMLKPSTSLMESAKIRPSRDPPDRCERQNVRREFWFPDLGAILAYSD
ncbi:hypothetical protein [Mesorhizobium sp. M7D.F.Ca.US.004.03.1.1]|uniref:hypothetical protein n=1 Tax=Mesorhizobium sp. M7D.F.Ca.US.004.03.1.1 TaxID=2496702 RepID=UPI0013E3CB0C|nr:hypothetical protein [Mesorhizobium sp. M7D.F.Ca.US.004.03.1.1]